jgi:hypothetical protein
MTSEPEPALTVTVALLRTGLWGLGRATSQPQRVPAAHTDPQPHGLQLHLNGKTETEQCQ